jgi:hypothetical protein
MASSAAPALRFWMQIGMGARAARRGLNSLMPLASEKLVAGAGFEPATFGL